MKNYIIQKDNNGYNTIYLSMKTICMILNFYHIIKRYPSENTEPLTPKDVLEKFRKISKAYNYRYGHDFIIFIPENSKNNESFIMISATSMIKYCIDTNESSEMSNVFRKISQNIGADVCKLTEKLHNMQGDINSALNNKKSENKSTSAEKINNKKKYHEGMIDFVTDDSNNMGTSSEMHFINDPYLPKETNQAKSNADSIPKEKEAQHTVTVKKVISPFKCIFIKDFHKILESNGYFISQADLYELFRKVFLYKSAGMWFPKNYLVKERNMMERFSQYHKGQEDELTYMSCTPVISPDGVKFFLDYFHNMRNDYQLYQKYFINKKTPE